MRTFYAIVFVFILLGLDCRAQPNLIPNPSFEDYENCSSNLNTDLIFVYKWDSWGSADYYNTCNFIFYSGITVLGVPHSFAGGQEPHTGDAYIGLALYGFIGPIYFNYSEYAYTRLDTFLKPNHKYDMKFYVSLADSVWYATSQFGAYFMSDTNEIYEYTEYNQIKQINPQLTLTGDGYLTSKDKWMEVKGSFIAQGGEKIMVLGNFRSDSLMDSLFVGGGTYGPFDSTDSEFYKSCYYYIDDVSLIEDTSYHPIGIEEEQLKLLRLGYFDGAIQLNGLLFERQNSKLKLYTVEGKSQGVFSIPAGTAKIPIEGISKGNYVYELLVSNQVVKRGKLWVGE